MADCLKLLHFHLGSQITNIRQIKGAVNEAVRVYAELARAGAGLKYLDVGGGLGIDYDGSQTDFESSVNYTLQEYANDVIYHMQNVCDEVGVAHPTIVTESGRAIVAYHSVLVFNVLGVSGMGEADVPPELPADAEQPLIDLQETFRSLTAQESAGKLSRRAAGARSGAEPVQPGLSAARAALHRGESVLGDLPQDSEAGARTGLLPRRAGRHRRDALRHVLLQLLAVPEHAGQLGDQAAFPHHADSPAGASSRRSRPCWATSPAIPTARWIQFIDRRDVKRTLPLHPYNGDDYYLGAFLLGAYQEILGDLHNLFGDTNAVHVRLSPTGEVILER